MNKILLGLIFCTFTSSAFAAAKPFTTKVRSGDTVYSILRREGFNENQRRMALAAQILPKKFVIAPDDRYVVTKIAKDHREIRFFSPSTPVAYLFWRKGNEAGGKVEKVDFLRKVESKEGKIRGSLVESISKVVGDDLVAYRFMDAYLFDYNLPRLLRKDAQFTISYEKLFFEGMFVRFGEVLSTGLEIGEEFIERTFQKISDGGVYIEAASQHEDRPLYSPVNYIRISSTYQPRRFHPIKKYRRAHLGVDFELQRGSPVLASNEGTILRMGRNRAAGNFVVISHKNGLETYYNHLDEIAEDIRKGMRISAGKTIGTIGCTGYCTKPHLHYAVKKKGRFVDPMPLLRGYSFSQRDQVTRHLARIYQD